MNISKETNERKRKFAELEETVDEVERNIQSATEENEESIQNARDEFQHAIETRRQTMLPRNERQSVRLWWNDSGSVT